MHSAYQSIRSGGPLNLKRHPLRVYLHPRFLGRPLVDQVGMNNPVRPCALPRLVPHPRKRLGVVAPQAAGSLDSENLRVGDRRAALLAKNQGAWDRLQNADETLCDPDLLLPVKEMEEEPGVDDIDLTVELVERRFRVQRVRRQKCGPERVLVEKQVVP